MEIKEIQVVPKLSPKYLTKKKFKEWINDFPDDNSVIGIKRTGDICPIARFIKKETKGKYFVIVGRQCIKLHPWTDEVPSPLFLTYDEIPSPLGAILYLTPKWVSRFINKIDITTFNSWPATKQQALEILNSL